MITLLDVLGAAATVGFLTACASHHLGQTACIALHVGPVSAIVHFTSATLSCSQGGILAGEGDALRTWAEPPFRAIALAADQQAELLVVAGGRPARSGEVAVYSADGRLLAQQIVAEDLLYAAAAHGRTAAVGGADGRVLLALELPSLALRRVRQTHTAPCRAVAFSPDGRMLVSAGLDGVLLMGSVDGEEAPVVVQDHTAGVECLAFVGTDRIVSGARDGKVRLHRLDGRLERTWPALREVVTAVAAWGTSVTVGLENGVVLRIDGDETRELAHCALPVHALCADGEGWLVGLEGKLVRVAGSPEHLK